MKLNLSKSRNRTQFYISFSVVMLMVVGLNLFDNGVDTTFAQTEINSSINNTNTTLATGEQSRLHPEIVLIIEEQGKITNQRVLQVYPHPVIESTFVANQTIFGDIQAHDLGTYWATTYSNGSLHGEGHGLSTTTDGEMVTWTAEGVGTTSSDGDVRFEGSLFFHTSSTGELSDLNNKVGFFEYEVDSGGNTSASVWELR